MHGSKRRGEGGLGRAWAGCTAAGLLGALVPLALFGVGPLDPRNEGWIWAELGVDPIQSWLGWTAFRQAPWALPPGASTAYGMELGTAIYFTDSLPLIALPLKAVRGLVEVRQYLGPWLFACGVLQGLAAWRLIGLVTADPLARVAGAGLLALQPMLMHRMTGHFSLAGQWTLLLALALAIAPGGARRGMAWAGLLAATALIHSYLLVMAGALWAADWIRRGWIDRLGSGRGALLEAAAVVATVGTALWAGGFFLLRGGHGSGVGSESGHYGSWSFDLAGFVDPDDWSAILPDLPDTGQWDSLGSHYLGLGGLVLLGAGLLAMAVRPARVPRRLLPLSLVLLLLLAFAVTHQVTVAGRVWTLFEPPAWFMDAAAVLRNSTRFALPLAYALLVAAVAVVTRNWGGRRTGWLLLGLLVLQWGDLRAGIALRGNEAASAPQAAPRRLRDPFWAEAIRTFERIRCVPAANIAVGWDSVGALAVRMGLATDCVYLARIDDAVLEALRVAVAGRLARGDYEPRTLYVLRDSESVAQAQAARDPRRDRLLHVDGFWVLAPGLGTASACRSCPDASDLARMP